MPEKKAESVFSDKPGAPVRHAPVQKAAIPHRESAPEQNTAGQKKQISVSELVKLINAPKPEKPLEKNPIWSYLLIITGAIFAAAIFFLSIAVAYFYFRGAIMSLIITLLLGIGASVFVLAATFMLCKIEKGIREIKTKL